MTSATMPTAIIGDIHGSLEALDAVLEDAEEQGVSAFACLGDIVGYGADPNACCERVRALDCPVVRGNHDHAVSYRVPLGWFNPVAAAAIRWTRKTVSAENRAWLRGLPLETSIADAQLVHASLDAPSKWHYLHPGEDPLSHFAKQTARICFCGHTHVPAVFVSAAGRVFFADLAPFRVRPEDDAKLAVNPGAVGQPRDGNPAAAYILFDPATGTIVPRRVPYDAEAAARKIREAGLPEFLAARIMVGR